MVTPTVGKVPRAGVSACATVSASGALCMHPARECHAEAHHAHKDNAPGPDVRMQQGGVVDVGGGRGKRRHLGRGDCLGAVHQAQLHVLQDGV
jgi:hypothetical protein